MAPRKKNTSRKSSSKKPTRGRSRSKTQASAKTTDGPTQSMFLFFTGLFLMGLGVFLYLSFFTADLSLDPGTLTETTHTAARECVTGLLGAWSAYFVILTVGFSAACLLAGLLMAWGAQIMRRNAFFVTWPQVLGGIVMILAASLLSGTFAPEAKLDSHGLIHLTLSPPLTLYCGTTGLVIISLLVFFLGSVLCFGEIVFEYGCLAGEKGLAILKAFMCALIGIGRVTRERLQPKVARAFISAADHAVVLVPKTTRRGRRSAQDEDDQNESNAREVEAAVIDDDPAPAEPAMEIEEEAAPIRDFEPYETALDGGMSNLEDSSFATAPTPPLHPYGTDEGEGPSSGATPKADPAPTVQPDPDAGPARETSSSRPTIKSRPKPPKLSRVEGAPKAEGDYQLPPLNLLDTTQSENTHTGGNLEKRAKILERTLGEFKIDGRVVAIECGPRVTLFEMTLAPGIKLSKVIGLADNISMALKAPSVRIIAPIPGKDTIGIEIPNIEKELVSLFQVVSSVNRSKRKQALPLCLSKDVGGKPIVADLAKMPHLLIAGATGSGKSVCINSIILSFLMCCKPSECKLIMIDPKVVELSLFKGIPHLMSPVITDMKRAVAVLEWACQTMDERYEQLSNVSVNNITKFNALGEAKIKERLANVLGEEEIQYYPKALPYITIIIDELADLMMVAGKEVEQHITRLAAKSRAVGIHLILATQRPSVDVITGLIKANMPSRIAFQVASKVDSRTILDQNGAETLLGAGDMLYLPPGVSKVNRAQGVFVSDEELFSVVEFCKSQMDPEYHEDLEGPVIGGNNKAEVEDFDDLFFDAGEAIIESGRGSVSLLQRKLGVGYGRAARIVDQLASVGVLGPFREGKAREIMMTQEEFGGCFAENHAMRGSVTNAPSSEEDSDEIAGLRNDENGPTDAPWDEENSEA